MSVRLHLIKILILHTFKNASFVKFSTQEKKIMIKNLTSFLLKVDHLFRECNMVQHSNLHHLSKSANDVQNLCKMYYARKY
ncbi:hypothetical protein BpHYR1_003643 [Brachionus plicatilis]|uniref:Uncharacterized protein n=1 Tax=Brachionus plicatilis TaxID=10195 RepID=A0A3M7PLD8_BRAPC|nr:hypothetical protein BpHYR1_003643 [Brachionus plicatilis]